MRCPTTPTLVLALGLLLVAACGRTDEETSPSRTSTASSPASSAAAPGVAALVPSDANVVVRLASVDRLTEVVRAVGALANQPAPGDPTMLMLASAGVTPGQVDRTRPCWIAASVEPGAPAPAPTFVLPVADPGAVAAAYRGAYKKTGDGYVALSAVAQDGAGSALVDGLPEGDVVVRLDLARLVEDHRAQIDQALAFAGKTKSRAGAGLPLAWLGGFRDAILSRARDVVDSAERLDAAVRLDGADLALDLAFLAKEGSPLATRPAAPSDLPAMAAALPEDAAAVVLVEFDPKGLVGMVASLVESSLPAGADTEQLTRMRKSITDVGSEWLVAADVGPDGLALLASGRVKDAATRLDAWAQAAAKTAANKAAGADVRVAGRRQVGDADVLRLEVVVDPDELAKQRGEQPSVVRRNLEQLFGGRTVALDLAARGDLVHAVIGHDVAAVLASDAPPPALARTLAAVPGELAFFVGFDLHTLAEGLGPAAPLPPNAPGRLELFGSRDGRTYHAGLRVGAAAGKQASAASDD